MVIKSKLDRIVLFVHLPKCAGSTLSDILYWQLCDNNYYTYGTYFYSGIYYYPVGFFLDELTYPVEDQIDRIYLSRDDLRAVIGHFYFGIHKKFMRPFTYVTVLRHPLERIFSLYKHFRKYMNYNHDFEEFIFKHHIIELFNDQTARISGLRTKESRSNIQTLELAKLNLEKYFSVVGVSEKFEETVLLLKYRLNFEKEIYLSRINESEDKATVNSLPQKVIERVIEMNNLDYELYNFALSKLNETLSAQDLIFRTELDILKNSQQLPEKQN